ncbi:MAG: hypothetical protein KAR11_07435 [Phycisphaerae bacterium]|nr:hypothetical protein [Phycisphaerae bacterium]
MGNSKKHQYRGTDALLTQIREIQRRRWTTAVLSVVVGSLGILAGGLLLVSLFGYWSDQPPSALRWCLFGFIMLLLTGGAGWVILRAILGRQNPAQTARFIESSCPEIGNDLINSVLLSEDQSQVSGDLVQFAINESNRHATRVDLSQSIRPAKKKLVRRLIVAGAAIIALLVFAAVQPAIFSRGLQAALSPTSYVTAVNDIKLIELSPGDASVFPEESLDIAVTISDDGLSKNLLIPEVVIEGQKHPRAMFADSHKSPDTLRFIYHIKNVREPLQYFVRIHDKTNNKNSRWPTDKPWYTVAIIHPTLKTFTAEYTYPNYTGLQPKTAELDPVSAEIKAPAGSQVKINLAFETPVAKGIVEFSDGTQAALAADANGEEFISNFPVEANGGMRFKFFSKSGRLLLQLPENGAQGDGFYPISAIPDAAPKIQFTAPKRNVEISPTDVLPMKIRATDDYGISRLELWIASPGQKAKPVENFNPSTVGKKKISTLYTWKPTGRKVGDTVVYFATVTDNRSGEKFGDPQTAMTKKYTITIRSKADIAKSRQNRYNQLQYELLRLLKIQSQHRVNTAIASRSKTLKDMLTTASEIEAGQKSILAKLRSLKSEFPFDGNLLDIKHAIALLAENEAPTAVQQAAALAGVTDLSQLFLKPCDALGATQNSIINALQDMLAIMPTLVAKKPDALNSQDAADLSPDAMQAKREALKNDLAKFIDEHQRIIEAAKRLNKKSLDDFTDADKKLLHELASLEDKWEKFLNEKFADFAKLAEQDFANPSLLKELLSIKTDVTMAKDALAKQSVEIATACENNGVENAKTLTANIEKWLPDEPDRKKWEMESPELQENFENAELPTELEDLVGDLLEEEEDLFEEMDDTTSKAAMSGNKGIGWDAVDGPISNMNAQGVTGNQLPNTSEIGGRSGEGRTGKASGEHVEDKAVGKGGRRTPTRLSSDPFQKGQINDVSTDPPGGATGGGKLSGSGAEGLEGSVPAGLKDQQKLKALAGKQANIVNRAERLQVRFKTGNYAKFKLSRAILLMNRVRNDLERGEYQNALRRRRGVISNLQDARKSFGKKLEVTGDTSAGGAKQIRDDISDAMKGKFPAEYREALQEYYKRLGS